MNKSYPLPKLWKSKAIEADCKTAKNLFRKRRSLGPLTAYLKAFSTAEAAAAHVISQLNVILAKPYDPIVFQRGQTIERVPAVSVAQAVMDSLTGPGRMPAEGEALLTWMQANEPRWRG